MKYKSLFVFCCASALLNGSGTGSHAQDEKSQVAIGANLAQNGSFENDAVFWVLPAGAAVDKREAHIGSAALRVTNQAAIQLIPASPGDALTASVWIKGRALTALTANQGATIAFEAYDASGARLGGVASPVNSGTFDWIQVKVEYTVPVNADKVFLRLTPGEGTTGDVWFDDTTVTLVPKTLEAENVLPDPGFEAGLGHFDVPAALKEQFQRDDQVKRSGAHSLRTTSNDPEVYLSVSQKLGNFSSGDIVHPSAWIKGKDLTVTYGNYGASIYIEFYDANNKWLAGNYPPPLKGTFDWTQISGKLEVPPGATRVVFGVRHLKGTVGTAWYDDLALKVEKRNPLRVYFQSPNYRGLISGAGEKTWRALVQVTPASDWKDTALLVESRILDTQGKTVAQTTLNVPGKSGEHPVSVSPPANLPDGAYFWRLAFSNVSGKTERFQLPVLKTAQKPIVAIDAEGFTVVNGQRFFPLGLYAANGSNREEDLKRIAGAGFNTILSYSYGFEKDYEAYLDRAQQNGLKIIFSLKDMLIPREGLDQTALDATITDRLVKLRDKPALLAWYINDERPIAYIPTLEKVYTHVKALDPNHPAYQVLGETRYLDYYYSSSDILGTDPYPVGKGDDLQMSTEWTQGTSAVARQSKAVWMVPQVMDSGVYSEKNPPRTPSVQEMKNQAYQAIIGGAKGLIFYSYFDLFYADHQRKFDDAAMEKRWPGVKQLAAEVNALIPAVLNGTSVPLNIPATARVRASAIQFNNQLLVLAANPYSSVESITINIPAGWKLTKTQQNDIKGTLQGNTLTLSLPSLGSGVFSLDPA